MKIIRSTYPNQPIRVAIRESHKIRVIKLHEILYCEANRNYTFFYLDDDTKCMICRSLAKVKKLLEPEGFVRIHKSFLVNGEYIKTLITERKSQLVLTNNKKLEVARRMKPIVVEWLFS